MVVVGVRCINSGQIPTARRSISIPLDLASLPEHQPPKQNPSSVPFLSAIWTDEVARLSWVVNSIAIRGSVMVSNGGSGPNSTPGKFGIGSWKPPLRSGWLRLRTRGISLADEVWVHREPASVIPAICSLVGRSGCYHMRGCVLEDWQWYQGHHRDRLQRESRFAPGFLFLASSRRSSVAHSVCIRREQPGL